MKFTSRILLIPVSLLLALALTTTVFAALGGEDVPIWIARFGQSFSAWLQGDSAEIAWVVWETNAPIQSLALQNDQVWAGAYQGGLQQWNLTQGPLNSYTVEDGLPGQDVLDVAVDAGGQKWLALLADGLALTQDGSTFSHLTPPGGVQAWDLALDGSDAWLATLGQGVWHYDNGTWIQYTSANSGLPHNDVYAVALAPGGAPWIGTIGYGIATLQDSTWISYTLPVSIPHPLEVGGILSNQAVVDIAVDSAGNKWFATDGSGVVMLDASNSAWTVYDEVNSGLNSNFIHSIFIDAQGNLWFGTLDGGVSRLSADRMNWLSYHTVNSALPEDDVLDQAVDAQGGLWLAAYDSGLAYYGALPLQPSAFNLAARGEPDLQPAARRGYALWFDPATHQWTLRWNGDGFPHTFTGQIMADGPLSLIGADGLEAGDEVAVIGSSLVITASEQMGNERVAFALGLEVSELTIRLQIDGAYYPFSLRVGSLGETPGSMPFRMPVVQPQPPSVRAGEDLTVEEGDVLLLQGVVSDTDSPLGMTSLWSLSNGDQQSDSLLWITTLPDEGIYTATLLVTDTNGLSSRDDAQITVLNVPPSVGVYVPGWAAFNTPVTFTAGIVDPGVLDTHTLTWDFGDGTPAVSGTETQRLHSYANQGIFTTTLTVDDHDGGVVVQRLPIQIDNFPPLVYAGETITVTEGVSFTQPVLYGDPGAAGLQAVADFGDSTPVQSWDLPIQGILDISHIYADNGIFTTTMVVTDDLGVFSRDQLTITVQNVAPLVNAGDEVYLDVNELMQLNGGFNDSGADQWSATVDYGDGSGLQPLGLIDHSFVLNHTYTVSGTCTLEVCVTDDDGGLGCDQVTVSVGLFNLGINAGPDQSSVEGSVVNFSGAAPADIPALAQVTWDFGDGNSSSGSLSTTHVYEENGIYTVRLTVVDEQGNAGRDALVVTVANATPNLSAAPVQPVLPFENANLALTFSDPGIKDALTVVVEWATGQVETFNLPAGANALNATHQYVSAGRYEVRVSITDDDGASYQIVVIILVNSDGKTLYLPKLNK